MVNNITVECLKSGVDVMLALHNVIKKVIVCLVMGKYFSEISSNKGDLQQQTDKILKLFPGTDIYFVQQDMPIPPKIFEKLYEN